MTTFTPNSRTMQPMAKFLSKEPMEIFCKAARESEAAGSAYNDCILAGWSAVGLAGWQKPLIGKKYVKDNPGSGDVHLDGVIGSKKPKKKDATAEDVMAGCTKIDFESIDFSQYKKIDLVSETPTGDDDGVDFEFSTAEVLKVDESLGLVFGFAIVCKKDGQDYYDVQGDHIPQDAMVKSAADFMENSRVAKEMHVGDQKGGIVFAFPLTEDIAKALGIESKTMGLLIAMKPPADVLGKFKSGEYTGFSIGGRRIEDEEVD